LILLVKGGAVLSIVVYSSEVLWDGKKQRQLIYQDVTERQKAERSPETVKTELP